MSWLEWGEAKQALLHIIIIRCIYLLGLIFLYRRNPSLIVFLLCAIYRNLVVYNNKGIVDLGNIFEITFSLRMCLIEIWILIESIEITFPIVKVCCIL